MPPFVTAHASIGYHPFGAFRLMLALLVVIQHFASFAPPAFQQAIVPLGIGSIAVLVFFAVSGFVIAEAIEQHYRGRIGPFLLNRAIRIFPPLFGAITVTFVLVGALIWTFGSIRPPEITDTAPLTRAVLAPANIIGNYLTVLPGAKWLGLDAEHPLIALVWSIRTELMFYLAMAGLMLAPARLYRITLALAGGAGFAVFGISARWNIGPDSLAFIPFFIFGVATSYVLRGSRTGILLALASLPLTLIAFCEEGRAIHPLLLAQFGPYDMPLRGFLLIVLLGAIPVLACMQTERFAELDRALGDLSYPLYLNHILVMISVRAFWPQVGWAALALAMAAALAISYAMYRLIEPGLLNLRGCIRRGAPATTMRNGIGAAPFADLRIARLPL